MLFETIFRLAVNATSMYGLIKDFDRLKDCPNAKWTLLQTLDNRSSRFLPRWFSIILSEAYLRDMRRILNLKNCKRVYCASFPPLVLSLDYYLYRCWSNLRNHHVFVMQ